MQKTKRRPFNSPRYTHECSSLCGRSCVEPAGSDLGGMPVAGGAELELRGAARGWLELEGDVAAAEARLEFAAAGAARVVLVLHLQRRPMV